MRGYIEKRGDGIHRLLIDLPREADGKRRRSSTTVHGTRKQAEADLARILNEMNDGSYIKPAEITVTEYLDKWLAQARTNLSPTTCRTYRRIIEGELRPALGHIKLSNLTPLQIQGFISDALAHPSKTGGGVRSPRTVQRFYMMLNKALNQAVRWQLISRNPCSMVDPPKVAHVEMRALDDAEIAEVLAAAKGTVFRGPVLLALTAGMRRGEILGLRWSDIDMTAGSLSVVRALQDSDDGLVFKQPKTRKGRRIILLPKSVIETLREYRDEQAAAHALRPPADAAYDDLVFTRTDGSPWHPGAFSAEFHQFMLRAKIKARFHDLRHTHATQLLKRGVPINVVSERLGHAKASITLDVYAHVLPSMQQEAAARVGEMLDEALRQAV